MASCCVNFCKQKATVKGDKYCEALERLSEAIIVCKGRPGRLAVEFRLLHDAARRHTSAPIAAADCGTDYSLVLQTLERIAVNKTRITRISY
jgi:hypothetical protein